ncbi:hypothetical protein GCM10009548_24100 [Streptomyces malaysiensis subsp. malaysiensis]
MHEQVYVVGLTVELPQLCAEVGADLPHDLLAPGEDGAVEDFPPVLRCEDQMSMEGMYDTSSPAYIGV